MPVQAVPAPPLGPAPRPVAWLQLAVGLALSVAAVRWAMPYGALFAVGLLALGTLMLGSALGKE